jgi:diaminopimelate decarboxylase
MLHRLLGQQKEHQGKLFFGGASSIDLASEFGTPLYVLESDSIRQTTYNLSSVSKKHHPNSCIAYAAKANSSLRLLSLINECGLDLDVASEGELEAGLRAGFHPSRMHLHGNFKSDNELRRAVQLKLEHVIIDNLSEIDRLEKTCEDEAASINVLLRVAPGIDPKTHEAISTGQEDTKFGLNLSDGSAEKALRKICSSKHLMFDGFHFHVGSQLLDAHAHEEAAKITAQFAIKHKEICGLPNILNVGGGLGIRYLPNDDVEPLDTFFSRIILAISNVYSSHSLKTPQIAYEFGRAIVGEAGTTLYKAGVIKTVPVQNKINTRTYISVDGGLSDNPRPQLYDAKYHVLNASRLNEKHDTPFRISGKHCETDTLFSEVFLPKTTSEGDILAVQCTGAYNQSMASNYNRFPRPAMVMIENNQVVLATRRETFDEMFATEMEIPKL